MVHIIVIHIIAVLYRACWVQPSMPNFLKLLLFVKLMCVHVCSCVSVHMHVYLYVYMCACMFVYVHIRPKRLIDLI